MEFSSLRREKSAERQERRLKTFSSISNISFTSGASSTTIVRKSLSITLPRDLGITQDEDGRVVKLSRSGSAHLSGVVQIGDLVNVFSGELDLLKGKSESCGAGDRIINDEFLNVNIIYGVLQVENRPLCPLIVEIGNRNNTSLGLALADAPGEKIRISSIQPGSLAERCGYLKPGDILMSIKVSEKKSISCSPAYYTSFETAQIIRNLTSSLSSLVMTILPLEAEQVQLQHQHRSLFNMLSGSTSKQYSSESTLTPEESCDNSEKEKVTVLSFSLWKDRLYEDWGFSLSDSGENSEEEGESSKGGSSTPDGGKNGAEILQIRPGGPAFAAGVMPGDRIIQINQQDVSYLDSTMLVPILAGLDDSLNLTVVRVNGEEGKS